MMPKARRCAAKTAKGTPCRMKPLEGQRFCFSHAKDKATKKKRTNARRAGGKNAAAQQKPKDGKPADVQTLEALQRHVGAELGLVQQLVPSSRRAMAVSRLVTVAAELIELKDLKHRVEALIEVLQQ